MSETLTLAAQWASLEAMTMTDLPVRLRQFLRAPFYLGANALLDIAESNGEIPDDVPVASFKDEVRQELDLEHWSLDEDATTLNAKWVAFRPSTDSFAPSIKAAVRKAFYCGAKAMFELLAMDLPVIRAELEAYYAEYPLPDGRHRHRMH